MREPTRAGPVAPVNRSGLVARGLGKSFKQRPVVKGVSLTVKRGEAVGLLGPNGAGKTTTFYMIMGLVPPGHRRDQRWTAPTSPACRCIAAPAWGSATCRRRRASSAA